MFRLAHVQVAGLLEPLHSALAVGHLARWLANAASQLQLSGKKQMRFRAVWQEVVTGRLLHVADRPWA